MNCRAEATGPPLARRRASAALTRLSSIHNPELSLEARTRAKAAARWDSEIRLSTTTNQDGAAAAESAYPAPRQNRANKPADLEPCSMSSCHSEKRSDEESACASVRLTSTAEKQTLRWPQGDRVLGRAQGYCRCCR